MVSVSDLATYSFCKRQLWLSKKAKIRSGERDLDSRVRFHVVRSITNLVDSRGKIGSLTGFMLKTLDNLPGKIVGTEVSLKRGNLSGRIDVLRKIKGGYIIQEEKSSDPPNGDGVWPNHLLQVDAYAFLAMGDSRYSPIISGIIIYNDLKPRRVEPNPKWAEEVLGKVIKLLEDDILPEAEEHMTKCVTCAYYTLCQVLPKRGGLEGTEIKNLFA